tara:strand:+ start:194 stop:406 length:213 start_codon:yes stop_codon:yes gene_type:complete
MRGVHANARSTRKYTWPQTIKRTNIFNGESVVLRFFAEHADGKATYKDPQTGNLYSNIPNSVAKRDEVSE